MIDIETIITPTTITFVIKNFFELHPTDEKVFNDYIIDK